MFLAKKNSIVLFLQTLCQHSKAERVTFSPLFDQSLPIDLPPTIISQGGKIKPVPGQLEWSSDESPEDKFYKEHPLKRQQNLRAVAIFFF